MAKLGKLNVEIGATNKTKRGMDSASRDIRKWASGIRKDNALNLDLTSMISKGYGAAPAALAKGAAAGIAALGVAAGATALAIKSGADNIDELADASKRLLGNKGATGALAGLRFAAEEAGVETGLLDKSMEKMLDTISKANRGEKGAIAAFERIGVDARDLQRLRPEQQFVAVADALGNIQNVGDRISLSRGIFGKGGGGMATLFTEGGDAIRAATNDMALYGKAISDIDAEKVGAMNDDIGRMKHAWEGVTMQLAVQFAPLVSEVSQRLLGMIGDAGGVGAAVDHAFNEGVNSVGSLLDAVEGLNIGWMKVKRTVTGVAIILHDIGKFAVDIGNAAATITPFGRRQKDDTEERLKGIPEHRRDEARRILEERGGFQNEKLDIRGGLLAENEDIQRQIKEAEERRRTKGTLGDRFKAWEHKAQDKATKDASVKLNTITEDRLETEDAITKELEKQTKEKQTQQRIDQAGQGPLALVAMNSMLGIKPREKQDEAKPIAAAAEKGVAATAVTESGPVALAASSEQERQPAIPRPAPPAMLARNPEQATTPKGKPGYGSKEYWDAQLFGRSGKGYESKRPTGEPDWKSKQLTDDRTRGYESKRPAPGMLARDGGWRDKVPQGEPKYKSENAKVSRGVATPGTPAPVADEAAQGDWRDGRKPLRNTGESAIQNALAANPTARQEKSATDMTETNALLREVRDALRSGVTGKYA